jgi:uncharacterized protein (PEP-CTERM system associated)
MSCVGTSRRHPKRQIVGRDRRQHLKLTLLLIVVAASERAATAAAQLAPGLDQPTAGAASGGPTPSGAPTALPPTSSGPFGLPNPSAPPNTIPAGVTPPAQPPPSGLALPAPGAGITTLQAYDPAAPAVLIHPYASLAETFYSNVFYTANDHQFAAGTSLIPGVSISADTPRFTGVLTGSVGGTLYVPSRNLDSITANAYGQGTGMVAANRLFVDVSTGITEASTTPGLGFVNPSTLPSTQRTLTVTSVVSPYLRESVDGLIDSELRYTLGATDFGQNTNVISTTTPQATTLANATSNEGTLTVTTGQNFTRISSRLVVDASSYNSGSIDQYTQFSAFDDVQYFIKPNIAVLGRAGYQNLEYPFASTANFAGATWLVGGRLGSAAEYGYVALEYGRTQGVYGLTGSANYQITPTLTFQAQLQQGIASGSQSFITSLSSSTLSPSGAIVNQSTGLPTTFYNPGVGVNNNVYRQHLYNFGLTETLGRNSYSLFTFYNSSQSLTPSTGAPNNSIGLNLSWTRDIHPDLNGYASASYSRTTNVATVNTPTPVSNSSTMTANIGLNRNFARALTGSVVYSFSYQTNGGQLVNGRPGNIAANTLQFVLTKAF